MPHCKEEPMTYCIADIHGEYELFMRLLDSIHYADSDRLIVCGDLIDKGNASVKLMQTVFAMPNVSCIKGNHEYDFFKFYRTRMHSAIMDFYAILWHLQQYFPGDGALLDWETVQTLTQLPFYIEEDKFICVHAGLPMDTNGSVVSPEEATYEEMVYDRSFKEPDVLPKDSKCVIFGHTPTTYLRHEPKILKYPRRDVASDSPDISDYCKVHLDTGVFLNGVLGCFRVDDCRSFYISK